MAQVQTGKTTVLDTSTPPKQLNQLRLELGFGAPAGMVALRYSRVLPSKTRIEPGFGLGQTGYISSLLITQPLLQQLTSISGNREILTTVELYGGYGLSLLRDQGRHVFTGREQFFPTGNYHWIDVGLSLQGTTPWFVLTAGIGATILVSGPDGIGGDNVDTETFWWLFPEGWYGKKGYSPSLWAGIGWGF